MVALKGPARVPGSSESFNYVYQLKKVCIVYEQVSQNFASVLNLTLQCHLNVALFQLIV